MESNGGRPNIGSPKVWHIHTKRWRHTPSDLQRLVDSRANCLFLAHAKDAHPMQIRFLEMNARPGQVLDLDVPPPFPSAIILP